VRTKFDIYLFIVSVWSSEGEYRCSRRIDTIGITRIIGEKSMVKYFNWKTTLRTRVCAAFFALFLFVYVLCLVSKVDSFSGLSIINCPSGFLERRLLKMTISSFDCIITRIIQRNCQLWTQDTERRQTKTKQKTQHRKLKRWATPTPPSSEGEYRCSRRIVYLTYAVEQELLTLPKHMISQSVLKVFLVPQWPLYCLSVYGLW
jgi:hypothetical protein